MMRLSSILSALLVVTLLAACNSSNGTPDGGLDDGSSIDSGADGGNGLLSCPINTGCLPNDECAGQTCVCGSTNDLIRDACWQDECLTLQATCALVCEARNCDPGPGPGSAPQLLSDQISARHLVATDQRIYYAETDIGWIEKTGGTPQKLVTAPANVNAFAVHGAFVYWRDNDGAVARIATSGGSIETLTTGVSGNGMVVGDDGVYYVTDDKVWRMPLAGGTADELGAITHDGPMVLDATRVYIGSFGGLLSSMPRAGGSATTLTQLNGLSANYIALFGGDIFIVTGNAFGSVLSLPKDGGTLRSLASVQRDPGHLNIDAEHVYYAWGTTCGKILSIPRCGGELQLVGQLEQPKAMASDATALYVAANGGLYRFGK